MQPNPISVAPDAQSISRGALRILRALNFAAVSELPLPSGHRVDLAAVGPTGEILIVEIKSSVADFHCDHKWREYLSYCDRLLFAVAPEFPAKLIPENVGLIIADAYSGARIRDGEYHSLASATRKAMLIRIARASSIRLSSANDPNWQSIDLA
jgi:hypothetical protein